MSVAVLPLPALTPPENATPYKVGGNVGPAGPVAPIGPG